MNDNAPAPANLTTEDVATRWGITTAGVRFYCNVGTRIKGQLVKLNCIRLGRKYRFTEKDLADFTAACERANQATQTVPFVPTRPAQQRAADEETREYLAKKGRKPVGA